MKSPRFAISMVELEEMFASATTEARRIQVQAEIDMRQSRMQENERVTQKARQFKRKGKNWVANGDGWPEWDGGI
jgi:hypothetical protein